MKFIFNTSYNTNSFSEYFKRKYQVRNVAKGARHLFLKG